MIRYQLRCGRGHGFEGWFRSSAAYADEVRDLACPLCSDATIEKAIMAPAVVQRGEKAPAAAVEGPTEAVMPPAASSPATAVATLPPAPTGGAPLSREQAQLARALVLMRKLKAHVEANFEHVGRRFAEEARKIHYEEAEPRGIYGEASPEEVRSLEDEGIAIARLPDLPKLDG